MKEAFEHSEALAPEETSSTEQQPGTRKKTETRNALGLTFASFLHGLRSIEAGTEISRADLIRMAVGSERYDAPDMSEPEKRDAYDVISPFIDTALQDGLLEETRMSKDSDGKNIPGTGVAFRRTDR